MDSITRFRHNAMQIDSISAFEGIRGGIHENCKDVYFVRLLGVREGLASEIRQMDLDMTKRMLEGQAVYQRVQGLLSIDPDMAAHYEGFYREWTMRQKERASTRLCGENTEYERLLGRGLLQVAELYFSGRMANASLEKNFVVKLLYWHDALLSDVKEQWDGRRPVKLVLSNITKRQEYYFTYLLTLLGYDVLLIQNAADIPEEEARLGLSQSVRLGEFGRLELPVYDREKAAEAVRAVKSSVRTAKTQELAPAPKVKILPKKPKAAGRQTEAEAKGMGLSSAEKSFEELALLASSVVLIAIHAPNGDVVGTGSGIMIGKEGYILTNSHVASGGSYYSVRVEDDETVYTTDELIKYHSVLDLALLRVARRLEPLPVYRGGRKLVRGQKVVAIGSPLGLFNSVSNGIISGFRRVDDVDMIQFTAPTSHGSSGGALFNMQGEVIGICTAGFDNAQNINLAVGYESILPFIKGFTDTI